MKKRKVPDNKEECGADRETRERDERGFQGGVKNQGKIKRPALKKRA